jgi:MFS family permease
VADFNITDDPSKLGYYVGFVASAFSVAQVGALFWGWLSDRIGRKPVLFCGLFGNAVFSILFGMSKTFWMAVAMRGLCGLVNGNKSVLSLGMAFNVDTAYG